MLDSLKAESPAATAANVSTHAVSVEEVGPSIDAAMPSTVCDINAPPIFCCYSIICLILVHLSRFRHEIANVLLWL